MSNGLHKLMCLNFCFPAGGAVWEGYGPLWGLALLEEACLQVRV